MTISDHVFDAAVAEVVFATEHALPLLFDGRGLLDHECSVHRGSFVVEVAIQSLFDYVDLLLELIDRDVEINSILVFGLSFNYLVNSTLDAFAGLRGVNREVRDEGF